MGISAQSVLEAGENIVWQGVINRKVINAFLVISFVAVFLLASYFFFGGSISATSQGKDVDLNGIFIGLAVLIIGSLVSLVTYYVSFVVEYTITDKRILIKSGIIGTDFQSIYFEQIKSMSVDVDLIGKIFSVGTIKLDTGKIETYSNRTQSSSNPSQNMQIRSRVAYDMLKYIDTPYEVSNILQGTLRTNKENLYGGQGNVVA